MPLPGVAHHSSSTRSASAERASERPRSHSGGDESGGGGSVLHLLGHVVRPDDARHRHLHASLLLLRLDDLLLAFLQEQVRVVLARELADLHQEVAQVLLEGRDVLVEAEEAFNEQLDLCTETRPAQIEDFYVL